MEGDILAQPQQQPTATAAAAAEAVAAMLKENKEYHSQSKADTITVLFPSLVTPCVRIET